MTQVTIHKGADDKYIVVVTEPSLTTKLTYVAQSLDHALNMAKEFLTDETTN